MMTLPVFREHKLSAFNHHYVIRDLLYLHDLVRRKEHSHSLGGERNHDLQDVLNSDGIESLYRLAEDQQFATAREAEQQSGFGSHSFGQLPNPALGGQLELIQETVFQIMIRAREERRRKMYDLSGPEHV